MGWVEITSIIAVVISSIGISFAFYKHNNDQHTRIYERLDRVKKDLLKDIEKDYARRDLCSMTHMQVDEKLREIQSQTALIPRIIAQLEILLNGKQ